MQLLEYFKDLTLHPKNAEELKGLILQLAIQGKLTAQWRKENPDVEPASVLMERIEVEKKDLIKAKKIKKENLEPISLDENYFEIPNSWEWQRLGNIGFIFNGNSVNKALKEAKYTNVESGYPYIGTKDVGYIFDTINDDNGVKIPFDEPKFKLAKKNTVLICSEGGSAGKKMGVVNQDCCFGNKLFAIEQYGNIDTIYILSLYGSASFGKIFKDNMTGIIGGISRNTFASLSIPIPPLEEQKTIVATVNQLFAEVEQLEDLTKQRIQTKEDFVKSALRELSTQDTNNAWAFLQPHFKSFFTEKSSVKKLRESILQLAVQGKLTKHWRTENPNTEEASILLERIKTEKEALIKAKKIKKEKPLPAITEDEIPYELPDGWEWCRLRDLSENIFDGPFGSHLKTADYTESGVQVVRLGNIKEGKFVFEKEAFISYEKYETIKQHTLITGDILVASFIHEGVNSCMFPTLPNLAVAKADCFTVRLMSNQLEHPFVLHILCAENTYQSLVPMVRGMTRLRINTSHLKELLVPLAPKEEQQAIAQKVNSLMALCDTLEKEIETHQTTQEHWMQSCLREVFEERKEVV